MKEKGKAKLQNAQKGLQKWKRRARSQGKHSFYLDTLSSKKRLVDEDDDLLSGLVVLKKG